MKSVYRFSLALAVCLLLLAPVGLLGQTTGTIEGQITDQSGAAFPGVTMELTGIHFQGTKTTVTAADGRYRFLSLIPGDYTVTATLAGFGKVQKKATVTLDATATANMQMALSTTAEVTVTGEAPADRLDVDDVGLELHRQGRRQAAALEPQLCRRRVRAAGRPGRQRRDAGPLAGDLDLRLDLGRELVPDRRRQHDERHQGHPGQGHQQRVHPGSRSQDLGLPGRVRPQHGRRGQRDHEVGRQRVPRRHLRLLQQPGARLGPEERHHARTTLRLGNSQTTTIATKNTRSEGGLDLGGFMVKDRVWFFAAYDRVITGSGLQPDERRHRTDERRAPRIRSRARAARSRTRSPRTSTP